VLIIDEFSHLLKLRLIKLLKVFAFLSYRCFTIRLVIIMHIMVTKR
jgi:hypothetical protein